MKFHRQDSSYIGVAEDEDSELPQPGTEVSIRSVKRINKTVAKKKQALEET